MPTSATAVFDIGKTNKKLLVFDRDFSVLLAETIRPEPVTDEDGDPCEDMESLTAWMKEQFRCLSKIDTLHVGALNISAYGASLVHLDENGKPVTPLYDYLKPAPAELEERFYSLFGGREEFALQTSSPPMGMLNSGFQLWRLREQKPDLFSLVRRTLHFPQYLSRLFTGRDVSEMTGIGCHTGMWDFERGDYHPWLGKEGLTDLLAPIATRPAPVRIVTGGKPCRVGAGIHDSSAALYPWMRHLSEPFLLLSTGSWSVCMNPFNRDPLTPEELSRDCLCYLTPDGAPVKSSRLFLGGEYDHQIDRLRNHFPQRRGSFPKPEAKLFAELASAGGPTRRLQPERARQSGPWPGRGSGNWQVERFASFREAYHQLLLDLVSLQGDAIELAEGGRPVSRIVVTGGFASNDGFLRLLASRFPDREVVAAELSEASALGAAMMPGSGLDVSESASEWLRVERKRPYKERILQTYRWSDAVG